MKQKIKLKPLKVKRYCCNTIVITQPGEYISV